MCDSYGRLHKKDDRAVKNHQEVPQMSTSDLSQGDVISVVVVVVAAEMVAVVVVVLLVNI